MIARAEVAFAAFPDSNILLAEAGLRRFYQFVKNVHREDFDVERGMPLEVNWWGIHSRLFGNVENHEPVEALMFLYEGTHGAEAEKFHQAVRQRAMECFIPISG